MLEAALALAFCGGVLMLAVAGIEALLFRRVPDGTGALVLRTKPVPVLALRASITSRKDIP